MSLNWRDTARLLRIIEFKRLVAAALLSVSAAAQTQTAITPTEQWYMRTPDEVVHYVLEYGRAASPDHVVVVLHGGWGAEHSYLIPAIAPLAGEYKFVLYDQRGSLRSPVTDPGTLRFETLISDLEALRVRLNTPKMTLMAHSMGAHLAFGYLAAYPENVRGLVLVGPTPPQPFGDPSPDLLRAIWPDFGDQDRDAMKARHAAYDDRAFRCTLRNAAAAGLIPAAAAEATQDNVSTFRLRERIQTDRQKTQWWRIQFTCINAFDGAQWRTMQGGQAFYNGKVGEAILKDTGYADRISNFWPALAQFSGPVRVVIGSEDYVDLGPVLWPRIVSKLRNGRLTVIERAGHSAWMDGAERFALALDSALKGVIQTEPR
jgi:pimeloyl-ACP methyl ester carboxylesterase